MFKYRQTADGDLTLVAFLIYTDLAMPPLGIYQFITKLLLIFVWALLLELGSEGVFGCAVLTTTLKGDICGFETESVNGVLVRQFLGIPYAEKPIGNRRFESPEEASGWQGVLNATSLPPACPQSHGATSYINGHFPGFNRTDEDCLYLNVYVPQKAGRSKKSLLPVFVWVHGGSNEAGMGAMLPGEILAAHGQIIVVNLNYRLDALGFLSFEDEHLPGNLGIRDQILALQWVHENIRAFSGDPGRVTVAGHSAGALDVGVLMLSPLTKGFFQNIVIQSGSAISFWSTMTASWRLRYRKIISKFLTQVKCNFSDTKRVKECLKERPLVDLEKAAPQRVDGFPILHPVVVDGHVLPDEPIRMLEKNMSHAHSVMLGFTKDEGVYLLGAKVYQKYTSNDFELSLEQLRDYLRDYHFYKYPASTTDIILHEYINWTTPTDVCSYVRNCAELFGDRSFSAPIHRTASHLSNWRRDKGDNTNVFIYSYEFDLDLKAKDDDCEYWKGVVHGQDIFYLFGVPLIGHERKMYQEEDKTMSVIVMEVWSNFVKYGRPFHRNYPDATFTEYDSSNQTYFRFVATDSGRAGIEGAQKFKPRKMAFWNRLMVRRESLNVECVSSGQAGILPFYWMQIFISYCLIVVKIGKRPSSSISVHSR